VVSLSIVQLPALAQTQVTIKPSDPPLLVDCSPSEGAPGTAITIHGYRLFVGKPDNAAVVFVRGTDRISIKQYGSGGFANNESNMIEYLSVAVPKALRKGRWHVVVEVDGRVSAPIDFTVTEWKPPVISEVLPGWAGPGTSVVIYAEGANSTDIIELTDERGAKHSVELRPGSGAAAAFTVPEEAADGPATLHIVNPAGTGESNSVSILISRGPLPIDLRHSVQLVLGRGQWLSLPAPPTGSDTYEIAFTRGTDSIIVPIEKGSWGVRIPFSVAAGPLELSTRAWRGGAPSFWSDPKPYTVLDRPAPTVVRFITVLGGPTTTGALSLYPGPEKPETFEAAPGNKLELAGTFPPGDRARLRLSLRNDSELIELKPDAYPIRERVTFRLPSTIGAGNWRLVLRTLEDGSSINLPIAMHVGGSGSQPATVEQLQVH
jgi:hypothetical protein